MGEHPSRRNINYKDLETEGWMKHLRNSVAEVEEGIGIELGMRSEI